MKKSQVPDLTITKLGNHLFRVDRKDGSSFLKWDWDNLLAEVIVATSDPVVVEQPVAKKRGRPKKVS